MPSPAYADFHVHTNYSPCGHPDATVAAMIRGAAKLGLAALGFSDHITPEPVAGCSFYYSQRPELLDELRADVEKVRHIATRSGMHLLVGAEADYSVAGVACMDSSLRVRADHIVCSASHFHLPGAPRAREETPRSKAKLMLRLAREMLCQPGVDIWAHPFDCSYLRPLAPIILTVREEEMAALIAQAREQGIAIEINGGAGIASGYLQALLPFLQLAREMGATFSVTSDAHHPMHLTRFLDTWEWVQAVGLDDAEFLTADVLRQRQNMHLRAISERKA